MKWSEWCRRCDVALGYWPSDHLSEGGSPASGDPGSLIHEDVDGWCQEQKMLMVGDPKWVQNFITLLRTECNWKTYELFISGVFHLMFSDHSWSWVIETVESEMVDKGDYHNSFEIQLFSVFLM